MCCTKVLLYDAVLSHEQLFVVCLRNLFSCETWLQKGCGLYIVALESVQMKERIYYSTYLPKDYTGGKQNLVHTVSPCFI